MASAASTMTYIDRKQQSQRLRLVAGVPVRVGRIDGTLVDVGRGGARVRHASALKVGTELQLSFMSGADRFVATARVVSCRIVALGVGEKGSAVFESSLRYAQMSAESREIVEQMMSTMPMSTSA